MPSTHDAMHHHPPTLPSSHSSGTNRYAVRKGTRFRTRQRTHMTPSSHLTYQHHPPGIPNQPAQQTILTPDNGQLEPRYQPKTQTRDQRPATFCADWDDCGQVSSSDEEEFRLHPAYSEMCYQSHQETSSPCLKPCRCNQLPTVDYVEEEGNQDIRHVYVHAQIRSAHFLAEHRSSLGSSSGVKQRHPRTGRRCVCQLRQPAVCGICQDLVSQRQLGNKVAIHLPSFQCAWENTNPRVSMPAGIPQSNCGLAIFIAGMLLGACIMYLIMRV